MLPSSQRGVALRSAVQHTLTQAAPCCAPWLGGMAQMGVGEPGLRGGPNAPWDYGMGAEVSPAQVLSPQSPVSFSHGSHALAAPEVQGQLHIGPACDRPASDQAPRV